MIQKPIRRSVDGIMWAIQSPPSLLVKTAERPNLKDHRSIKPLKSTLKSRQVVNTKLSKVKPHLQLVVFVAICIVLGFASYNLTLGQIAIGVYGIASLIFRVKSQTTFTLALIALVSVPLLILLHNSELSDNYAVYTFLLLVVGVISAALELKREGPIEA